MIEMGTDDFSYTHSMDDTDNMDLDKDNEQLDSFSDHERDIKPRRTAISPLHDDDYDSDQTIYKHRRSGSHDYPEAQGNSEEQDNNSGVEGQSEQRDAENLPPDDVINPIRGSDVIQSTADFLRSTTTQLSRLSALLEEQIPLIKHEEKDKDDQLFKLKTDSNDHSASTSSLRDDLDASRLEVEELKVQLANSEKDYKELQTQLQESQTQLQESHTQLQESQTQLQRAQARLQQAQTQLRQLQQAQQEAENKLQSTNDLQRQASTPNIDRSNKNSSTGGSSRKVDDTRNNNGEESSSRSRTGSLASQRKEGQHLQHSLSSRSVDGRHRETDNGSSPLARLDQSEANTSTQSLSRLSRERPQSPSPPSKRPKTNTSNATSAVSRPIKHPSQGNIDGGTGLKGLGLLDLDKGAPKLPDFKKKTKPQGDNDGSFASNKSIISDRSQESLFPNYRSPQPKATVTYQGKKNNHKDHDAAEEQDDDEGVQDSGSGRTAATTTSKNKSAATTLRISPKLSSAKQKKLDRLAEGGLDLRDPDTNVWNFFATRNKVAIRKFQKEFMNMTVTPTNDSVREHRDDCMRELRNEYGYVLNDDDKKGNFISKFAETVERVTKRRSKDPTAKFTSGDWSDSSLDGTNKDQIRLELKKPQDKDIK